jgi:hypothetical protein
MSRYAAACDKLAARLGLGRTGTALVLVPPGEQGLIAQVLTERLADYPVLPLSSELLEHGPPRTVVPGLPRESKQRAALLSELNGRRDWLRSNGRQLVILHERYDLPDIMRLAADVYAANMFTEVIPFEPDTAVDPAEARRAVAQWLRKRSGHLDLRGFVRAESEDVSWRIEDIYQELKATHWEVGAQELDEQKIHTLRKQRLLSQELDALATAGWLSDKPIVILGHPGAGKSFFLRWLAMNAANRERMWGMTQPLPILLPLAVYAQTPGRLSLLERLVEELLLAGQPAAHVLSQFIAEKRAVFLLDGLDELGSSMTRRWVARAVQELHESAPGCPVIVTSRIAGYDASTLAANHYVLAPFEDDDIKQFLRCWCVLYAQDRLGRDPVVRKQAEEEGEKLAMDVLTSAGVRELASSPLMLTVLAIVHRTGVRLPEHRVELYEHVTRILVERWNRLRGPSQATAAPPLKVADAVRLLEPVALHVVRAGTQGAIAEADLYAILKSTIAGNKLQRLTTADEALELFRGTLGLLVERGVGLFAFLHLSLAEYFAAWELVRSGELEELAADPMEAFSPRWRETLLLAAGILGISQAADERLAGLVEVLLVSAARRAKKQPSLGVPSLLGGLLADDPGLSMDSARSLIHALVPQWWLESIIDIEFLDGLSEAQEISRYIMRGRFSGELRERARACYGKGLPPRILEQALPSTPREYYRSYYEFLLLLHVDPGPFMLQLLRKGRRLFLALNFSRSMINSHESDGSVVFNFKVSRQLDRAARDGDFLITIIRLVAEPDGRMQAAVFLVRSISWHQLVQVMNVDDVEMMVGLSLSPTVANELPSNFEAYVEIHPRREE